MEATVIKVWWIPPPPQSWDLSREGGWGRGACRSGLVPTRQVRCSPVWCLDEPDNTHSLQAPPHNPAGAVGGGLSTRQLGTTNQKLLVLAGTLAKSKTTCWREGPGRPVLKRPTTAWAPICIIPNRLLLRCKAGRGGGLMHCAWWGEGWAVTLCRSGGGGGIGCSPVQP